MTHYNIACEPVPFDWISDSILVQRFNALRQVSLLQFVYAILAYALTFTTVWGHSPDDISASNWHTLCQGFGGISILSIIACIVIRIRLDSEKTLTLVKIYLGLTVADILAWGARMGYIIYNLNKKNWEFPVREFFLSCIPHFFVLVLLLVGMSVAAKVIHRTTVQQYSLLSDGSEDSPASRLATDLYPVRIVSFVQLVFAAASFVMVFAPATDTYDLTTLILVTPAAGVLTVISVPLLFLCTGVGKRILTIYAMLQTIDMVTGICRAVSGILYFILWINKGSEFIVSRELVIQTSLLTAFPIFYWILGIFTAYRTRVHIDLDAYLSNTDVERVYGI